MSSNLSNVQYLQDLLSIVVVREVWLEFNCLVMIILKSNFQFS